MKSSKCLGRPRAFDPDAALEKAMHLFWRKGYEGTSLTDLTEAMGINKPSLYAAFGNKEELFLKAFERYGETAASCGRNVREFVKVRDAVEAYVFGAIDTLSQPEHPGCLSVVAALACSEESESVRQELCAARNSALEAWQARFERAVAEGDLPQGVDPNALARYLMTVMTGMTVQARSGATADDLRKVAEVVLAAWPTS